ncbi:MAG TPA: hypothetical protein VK040_07705 [Balneolaceae bacterium]|nr:hypothetical protein [Balneolaceae bacterium]
MKSLKASLFILSIALLSSCASITDTNLPEEEFLQESGRDQVTHQDAGDFFNSGDQEDIIDVRPKDRIRDRP